MTNPLFPEPDTADEPRADEPRADEPRADEPRAAEPRAAEPRGLTPQARRAVLAAWFGTLIEWYDYALYGIASALVIGPLFFPKSLPATQQLLSFATFAVGFVVRPLGGFVISHLGDRYGRKPAMLLTVVLMGIATVGMGVLPTAGQVGIWAPVLLVVLRFLQGFGAGAELAGALTLVSEYTPHARRGFWVGAVTTGAPGGAFLATLAFTLATFLPHSLVSSWGWRVPFLVSAVLFVLALWIRRTLEETPAYAAAVEARARDERAQRVPLGEVLRHSPRQLLAGFLSVTGHNVVNYVLSAFALGYLTKTGHMPLMHALVAVLVSSLVAAVVPPLGGLVVDRVGVRAVVAFGGLAGAVLAYPLFWSLQSGSMVLATLGMSLAGLLAMGATSPGTSTFVANLFPTRYRFTGVAAAREANGALVAGPTPLVATALIQHAHGGIGPVSAFVAVAALCTTASIFVAGRSGQHAPVEPGMPEQAVR